MTFKSIILGGAAAVALTCGGFVASSFAQTAPADQSAPPAATAPATPATQAAPAEKPAADDTATTTKHVKHHRRMHTARNGSTKHERAETQKLNQDQLAKAQSASQGQYGTMEQQPQPGSEPSNVNNAPAPSTSNDTGGPNTAAPSETAQPSDSSKTAAPNTSTPPANNPQAPNPSTPPQK
jgi:hypothetical protein